MHKDDYSKIKTKGFTQIWWDKHAAKRWRKRVGKALDDCADFEMDEKGYFDTEWIKAESDLKYVITAQSVLVNMLETTAKNCNKLESETKNGIEEYYLPILKKSRKNLRELQLEFMADQKKSTGEDTVENMMKLIDAKLVPVDEAVQKSIKTLVANFKNLDKLEKGVKILARQGSSYSAEYWSNFLSKISYDMMQKSLINLEKISTVLKKKYKIQFVTMERMQWVKVVRIDCTMLKGTCSR